MAVHPHLEVLGKDKVFLGLLLIPVSFGDMEHITPRSGTVFRTPAGILSAGGYQKGKHPVAERKGKQIPNGIVCPPNGKGSVHRGRQPCQQI